MGNNNSTENMNKNARKAKGKKKRISIVFEVAALFLIGVIMTGLLTYVCENSLYSDSVVKQTESRAEEIANETKAAVTEYAAYDWLINYWYINYEDLNIEYDVDFSSSTATAGKCKVFSERHPELQLRYISSAQCESLPQEDQKLYAEIAYSWLITRIDQIKRTYPVSYLFCVISEEPFDKQFFLFSGADEGAVRGTSYEEVYTLGHKVSVSESQTVAMREATKNTSHLADANKYVDYYVLLWSFGEHNVFIGLTYDYSELQGLIDAQTAKGATLAILNQIILSVICLTLITLFVIVPLKKVQAFIRQYKNSKDSESVIAGLKKIELRNEIGELSEDTSEMIEEIENHIAELQTVTAEKERISTELSLATRIQAAMLPSTFPPFPWRREFDVFASMDPAKEVGGDFYDFFMLDDDHIALVIADVSGKGIPAALFMMISKILVKNYAMTGLSPAKTLEAVNRQICANNREEMFVTVWLGFFEISTGKLIASNAGHEYPIVKKPNGTFELIKDKHGLVVGAMDGAKYSEYEILLEAGSKLFVYTDGLPEATDADENMFGSERLITALNGVSPDASSEDILRSVRGAVDDFVKSAEQFDDLTMLCFEYKGTNAK